MLADKYIPTRLVFPSERPKVKMTFPRRPSWLRLAFLAAAVVREFFFLLWFILVKRGNLAEERQRAQEFWQQVGLVWIKAAQLLALHGDLLPDAIKKELPTFQDVGDGVPFECVRPIVEQELGRPLESVFERFEEQPFLATSVAQLHRAYLRSDKAWVTVKVQKPYVNRMFRQDMMIVRKIAWLFNALSIYLNIHWDDLCKQLEEQVSKELDLRYEASSLRQLKKNLRKHGVYVPKTFQAYSSRRVLVMEFIHGALLSDFITLTESEPVRLETWLQKNNIQPGRVAQRLFFSVYRQIFEDNLFHSDMRPDNIVLLRNSRLAVLDCRSVGSLELELLEKYRRFFLALVQHRYESAADIYFLLAVSLPDIDITVVKSKLIRIWRVWETRTHIQDLPYHQKSITAMFAQVDTTLFQYQFAIHWPLSRLMRTWTNLDTSLTYLKPDIKYLSFLRKYFAQAARRTQKNTVRQLPARMSDSILALQELSAQYSEFSYFQDAVLRRQVQIFQGKVSPPWAAVGKLLGAVGMALCVVEGAAFGALLHQWLHLPIQQVFGSQITAWLTHLPGLHWGQWITILAAGIALLTGIKKLQRRLEKATTVMHDLHSSV